MKFPVYAVRDNKSNQFASLTVAANDAVITRSFAESIVSGRDPVMSFSPKDFDLYRVGEFDVDKGVLIPLSPVVLIANAAEVLVNYELPKKE